MNYIYNLEMLNLMKFINVPVFIISLCVGVFFVYITIPDTRKIYVHPSPDNIDILQYKDKANTCFQFKQKEISCPKNDKDIFKVPSQS
jgi:hypothetical protein